MSFAIDSHQNLLRIHPFRADPRQVQEDSPKSSLIQEMSRLTRKARKLVRLSRDTLLLANRARGRRRQQR